VDRKLLLGWTCWSSQMFWSSAGFTLPDTTGALEHPTRHVCSHRIESSLCLRSQRDFAAAAASWKNPQFVATVLHYYRTRWGGALSLRAYEALQAKLNQKPKAKISVPTVFAQGSMDQSDLPAGSAEQAEYFKGGYRRVILKGVGHFPNRENPAAVAKLLESQL
jgi:pimeloyl-ACP methyl ester carboxylesterase